MTFGLRESERPVRQAKVRSFASTILSSFRTVAAGSSDGDIIPNDENSIPSGHELLANIGSMAMSQVEAGLPLRQRGWRLAVEKPAGASGYRCG